MDWVGQLQWTAAIGVLLVFLILGMRFFTILFFEIDSWRLALKFRYIFSRFMEISIENSIHFFCNNKGLFVFFFFFSSPITPHSIFVTRHSSLKIPQFPNIYPFGTLHSASHHSQFSDFCETHTCYLVRPKLLAYPRTHLFLFSHFPFTLFTLLKPKPKPKPIKISKAPLPRPNCHQ